MLVHRNCQALNEDTRNLHTASGRTQYVPSFSIWFNEDDAKHWRFVFDDEKTEEFRRYFHLSKSQVIWEGKRREDSRYVLRIRYTLHADRLILMHKIGARLPHYYEGGPENLFFIRPGYIEVPPTFRGETSHLCLNGDESCAQPDHLAYEPRSVNEQRLHCYPKAVCVRNGCGLLLPMPDPRDPGYQRCISHGTHPQCLPPIRIPDDRLCQGHEGAWSLAPPFTNGNRQIPPVAPSSCPLRMDPGKKEKRKRKKSDVTETPTPTPPQTPQSSNLGEAEEEELDL